LQKKGKKGQEKAGKNISFFLEQMTKKINFVVPKAKDFREGVIKRIVL